MATKTAKKQSFGSSEEAGSDRRKKTSGGGDFFSRVFSDKTFQELVDAKKQLADGVPFEDLELIKGMYSLGEKLYEGEGLNLSQEELEALRSTKKVKFEDLDIDDMKDKSKMLSSLIYLVLVQGVSPKDALQCSDGMMETLYAQGYTLFSAGKNKEAEEVFKLLAFLDPPQARYHLGLAASLHKGKKYEDAIIEYLSTWVLDSTNPLPQYHSADCFLELNDIDSAQEILDQALATCGTNEKWKELKSKIVIMKKAIADKLAKIPPDKRPKPKNKPTQLMEDARMLIQAGKVPAMEDVIKDGERKLKARLDEQVAKKKS